MSQNRIKLVVSDLDGTLLGADRTISDAAVEAIEGLQAQGVLFTFITGRPPYAAEQFATRVPPTAPIVCCNGAVIVDGGSVLYERSFHLSQLLPVMHRAAALGLTVLVYAQGTEYALAPTAWTASREATGRRFPIFIADHDSHTSVEKVNIMADGGEQEFASLEQELRRLGHLYSITMYGNTGCEVVAKGTDKATGLLELCRLTKTDPSEVLAVGDNENDHPMLLLAGVGAAVANATAETKLVADYCCELSNTDGVVEAIHKFAYKGAAR